MNQPIHEKDFQTLFDTAGKILEATYTDEQLTRQAIQALNQTRERLERRLNLLAQEVEHTITSSASSTATAAVIPPFLGAFKSRGHAAFARCCFGV